MEEQSQRLPRCAPVKLLWTGGWDSTFRLLELVLAHEVRVQPYYLVVPTRRSTLEELRTMVKIRQMISARSPLAAELIEPTVLVGLDGLKPDPEVANWLSQLSTRGHVGPQYGWLSRFAREHEIEGLELGVIAHGRIDALLRGNLRPVEDVTERRSWALLRPGTGGLQLFDRFRFPLLDLDKKQMEQIARDLGFDDILEETWFCHSPRLGKPCGVCLPCEYAREGGMDRRIPRYRNTRVYRNAWKAARGLYLLVRRLRSHEP